MADAGDFEPIGSVEVTAYVSLPAACPSLAVNGCDLEAGEQEEIIQDIDPPAWPEASWETRVIRSAVPLYRGDKPSMYAGHRFESFPAVIARRKGLKCSDCSVLGGSSTFDFAIARANFLEADLDGDGQLSMREYVAQHQTGNAASRRSRPFLCDDQRQPYNFTVFGDSHAFLFDMAALRVENQFNIHWLLGATLRGLTNKSSATGASRMFVEAAGQRAGRGDVLIILLGDNDVHGLAPGKY